jgi:hypothetical protein
MTLNTIRARKRFDHEHPNSFVVVHPLDDAPEEKVDTTGAGPLRLTRSVKLSLMALRGYLILITLLLLYHVMGLSGLFGHWNW